MDRIIKKWYTITIISGKEDKVMESLRNRAVSEGVEDHFDLKDGFKVMNVPHIAPKELEKKKNGENFKVKTKNLYKGYIFVKISMTNETWFLVRNTQYVTGLVGSSGQRAKPSPISDLEIRKMEKKVEKVTNEFNAGKIKFAFKVGAIVEIIDGPAKGQFGSVLEINDNREVAIIELILFERKTPTEVAYKNLKTKN